MAQSFLYDWHDEGHEGCPHDDTYEYTLSGKAFDGHRERRVYCRDCASVVERERLPLEGSA